ncbi:hypothetical protein K435DRAFT_835829 [Dendrothele bispora CBS 962.96]|uniref:Gylcosyl hydrolase 115 C-terminal domain-containing protein n=1 Tax=Dendrothele bispora (strain CBS 962.96) TaxID=1314807 RepID=A0A4S8MLX1_DENBC|nr:hypothetical protein K435DRAFT_835829 [Dendrothele bispora CBS 962.96]
MLGLLILYITFLSLLNHVNALGQTRCVEFNSSTSNFAVVREGNAAPILLAEDEWPGVQRAASDFADDIQRVTGVRPSLSNSSTSTNAARPIIVGTLGHSALIDQVINTTQMDVSSIQGSWESFMGMEVENPLPDVDSAYVIVGADKRGTIFALYDLSEQFGVSPWYWWADVPVKQHSELFISSSGCAHGPPTVQYRAIFLNDEEPGLTNWALEKFTNGTGAPGTGSPFNRLFYSKLFELLLRMKANHLWPAMWNSAFNVDDPEDKVLADMFGIVMGTSHEEPMMRAIPPEWTLFGQGDWNYTTNSDFIYQFWVNGTKRAKPFESLFTMGMRGNGDEPLGEGTNIALLERVISDQRQILTDVFNGTDITTIPQVWTLYKEVQGYWEDGMPAPDDMALLWSDDNWGNIRRFPIESERNRSGGSGVYYHVDYVGDPRDYKWITSSQIPKMYEQLSLAIERDAKRIWVVNVGDLKPCERETEFFLNFGYDSSLWNLTNLDSWVSAWAQRDFGLDEENTAAVVDLVANLTRFNARRKPELLSSDTFSLINYREADTVTNQWDKLVNASTELYNSLPNDTQPAFYQLVHHPIIASANLNKLLITTGQNSMRASQAFLSTNQLADTAVELFEKDFDLEVDYHSLLDGKWDHIMDQTHIGYYYWQQPMTNALTGLARVQARKEALAGVMRVAIEGSLGAMPGDNPNNCADGCALTLDPFDPITNRFIDVGAGGPAPFTFNVSSNVSWLDFSMTQGSISPDHPEQRVWVSVSNWDKLEDGDNLAMITITPTAPNGPELTVGMRRAGAAIPFVARKMEVPGNFSGFVEGGGAIAIEAAHTSRNTSVDGITWSEIPGLGRTLSGITPWPRSGADGRNFSAGDGPSVEYDFFTFDTIQDSGNITVITHVSPSLNANGEDRPLGFAAQVDDLPTQSSYFMPLAEPGQLPDAWNDFVANSIVPVNMTFTGVSPGAHTLKIFMIEPAVVVQRVVIDTGGLKPSYFGPPESACV